MAWGDQLVHNFKPTFIPNFLVEAANNGLVIQGHWGVSSSGQSDPVSLEMGPCRYQDRIGPLPTSAARAFCLRNRAEEAEDGKAKRQPTLEELGLQCGRVFSLSALLQLRVLGFGLLQDGDVRVGVFPEREEILIRDTGTRCISLQRQGLG